jgi:hypothetical protein
MNLPKTFGVFSPTGHVVMGFTSDEAMKAARQALLAAGFNETSITSFSSQEVVLEIDTMKSNASIVAVHADEGRWMEQHLELARRGGGFLVVYAPDESESTHAVDIARDFGLKLAHKYNRLTLVDLR